MPKTTLATKVFLPGQLSRSYILAEWRYSKPSCGVTPLRLMWFACVGLSDGKRLKLSAAPQGSRGRSSTWALALPSPARTLAKDRRSVKAFSRKGFGKLGQESTGMFLMAA